MFLEMKPSLRLTQQLILTPQLQQAIKLLQVTRIELTDMITQELEENPLLEIDDNDNEMLLVEELTENDSVQLIDIAPSQQTSQELTGEGDGKEEFDWNNYLEDYAVTGSSKHQQEDEEITWDNLLVKAETLIDHLMWQLKMSKVSNEEFLAGEFIIKSLDEDGYLKISIDEIARESSCSMEVVESALAKVQDFDPAGVAARDLCECLLIQAKALECQPLVATIIKNHIRELELRNYSQIVKKLKVPETTVMLAIKVIREMNPKPGSIYSNNDGTQMVVPDVLIVASDGDYRVILNDDGIPRLRISNIYQEIISHTDGDKDKAENKKYISDRMQSAKWLMKALEQRRITIRKVSESIVKFQRDFFDKGAGHLKPLILRDIAEDIQMHESTVSRVVSNKYALTPRGTFLLKYFFSNFLNTWDGETIATTAVKEEIKKILLNEDPKKPYNDSQIEAKLKAKGIIVARRTVAKYREMMNILPSSRRKQFL